MARVHRHRCAIAGCLLALVALALAPALAQDQGPNAGTDLYDRPVLAIDPGMHTAKIRAQAVDSAGRFAVTGGDDRTVRVWSIADGTLLRTIWIPVGPENVGAVYAVAISPDGSTIAAGGYMERIQGDVPIYVFDRESGNLIRRIHGGLPDVTFFLTFSTDGRYLAATLAGGNGLRVFDRDKDWSEVFRDDRYGDNSYGASFAHDGRLATTALDGMIRLYEYGEFGGLGVQLIEEDGLIKVVTPIEGTPAAKAGVLSGDVIGAIDDAPTQGLALDQAVDKLRGAVNSPVKLKIVRGPQKEVKEFTIVRDVIRGQSSFRRIGEPVKMSTGRLPYDLAFSPDGKRLAVGYYDVAAVDVLDGTTLSRVGGESPAGVQPGTVGLSAVAWSHDGQTLFAVGSASDAQERYLLFSWNRGGLGDERRLTYCASNTATDVNSLPDGRIFLASTQACFGLMSDRGQPIWTVASPILDFRGERDLLRVSPDGQVVEFGYGASNGAGLKFDIRALAKSAPSTSAYPTFAPNREGLKIDGWADGATPILNGRALPLSRYDKGRSLAIAADAKRFFLGSAFALTAFDDMGVQRWRVESRNEVKAINASKDGRIVVTADGDGAIRWRRADDGRELLTLQVLPNKNEPGKWDWVLWTPEGFYEATPGAQDALKWVVNHGPDSAASTLPVSAIPRLHRPDALPLVLQELETARALGIAELTAGRLAVQKATGSAKPPGGTLHVLAIGVDKFGDKAGDLHLDYAAEDAHDVASALQESQKLGPEKASLYADVKVQYLPNDQADNTAIRDALDDMATSMATSSAGQDVAVILVSSHGEMIDGQFYLVPYGVDLGSKNRIIASALSATDFGKKVQAVAAHGKVLLLLDACHSGAVRPGGWATDPDAKVLRDVLNMDNVTVLTSSDEKGLSEELPAWRHGALAQAFLDALTGAGDSNGIIRLTGLINQMDGDLRTLTQGRQSLGQHANFGGDLFMASHY
jgi:WD40 repeat protein